MSRTNQLLDRLGRANPVPDPADLADSDVAAELAMRRAGSVLNWDISDGEYQADGYRIRLVEPGNWEITFRAAVIAFNGSRKAAFRIAEDHRRQAIRRRDLIRLALTFVLTIAGWIGAGLIARELWVLALPVVLFVSFATLIRFFAVLSRNVMDPYRRLLPWEKRSWRRRLFERR